MSSIQGVQGPTYGTPVSPFAYHPPVPGSPKAPSPLETAVQLATEPMAITRQKAMAGDPRAIQTVAQWRAANAFLEPKATKPSSPLTTFLVNILA